MTLKYNYLGENETKNENILTRWSVTQAGSNYEKNGGPKYRWTVPLIVIFGSLYFNFYLAYSYIALKYKIISVH